MVEKESKKVKETKQAAKDISQVDPQAFVNRKLAILAGKSGVKYTEIANRLVENNKEDQSHE